MTFGLLRQIYEKIANIGKQTLHKESEEFNMKKEVLSVRALHRVAQRVTATQ